MAPIKSALILVASGFQDEEFIYPLYRLQEAGFETLVATPSGDDVFGKFGVPARATMSISESVQLNPDLLYLPGGFESPDRVRLLPESGEVVRQADNRGIPIGAICHGPWILISAGIVAGRQMTGYLSILVDLQNAGAIVPDSPVVRDGNLVTADHYRNNGEFMKELLRVV